MLCCVVFCFGHGAENSRQNVILFSARSHNLVRKQTRLTKQKTIEDIVVVFCFNAVGVYIYRFVLECNVSEYSRF